MSMRLNQAGVIFEFLNRRCAFGMAGMRRWSPESVHVEVKHPDEINTLFDPAIVYAKGGALCTVARSLVGR